jgi:hypothetical protein
MLIAKLGLAPATKRALQAAGIETAGQLQRHANELLATEPITGVMLYDVVCRLRAHNLGLRVNPRMSLPTEGDLEMLRLRVVEGLALRDIGFICGVSPEHVRQRLNTRFGLSGQPPAALERHYLRVGRRPDWERIIALRLCRCDDDGLPMAIVLRGFADGPMAGEARAAVGRMEVKGLLAVKGDRVRPTAALRVMAKRSPSANGTRRGIGSARAGG